MNKESHKLAVIFPGIGYTADKPLLYFGRRIAVDCGYEIRIRFLLHCARLRRCLPA